MMDAVSSPPVVAAASPNSFWRRRVTGPLIGQLRQGATPDALAASLAWGGAISTFPILGTTTALCGLAATIFRMNHVAIQITNWLATPLQWILIIPFLKLGSFLFGAPPFTLSIEEITAQFSADFGGAVISLGGAAIRGILAWALTVGPLAWLLTMILRIPLRRLARTIAALRGAA